MAEDRNALLAVLAVKRGWAQPAEVLAAQVALGVHRDRDLAQELVDAGAVTVERARDLESLADKALAQAGGNAAKAIAANGGIGVIAPASKPFDDDDDEPTRMKAAPSRADDEDEPTSIKMDLNAPAAKKTASLDDEDEEESTKVLDWERATRKSIEKAAEVPPPPRKK